MQMLAEMLMEREEIASIQEFVTQALACGHQGMLSFREKAAENASAVEIDEGI